jgi:hypothetical protein
MMLELNSIKISFLDFGLVFPGAGFSEKTRTIVRGKYFVIK